MLAVRVRIAALRLRRELLIGGGAVSPARRRGTGKAGVRLQVGEMDNPLRTSSLACASS